MGEIMLLRTPFIGIILAGIVTVLLILLFEVPGRPFTVGQGLGLYFFALITCIGVAMLFDPHAKKAKEDFLKINFYEEKK